MTAADKKLKRDTARRKLANQLSVLGRTETKKNMHLISEMSALFGRIS